MRLQTAPTATSAGQNLIAAACLSTDDIGNAVYIRDNRAGGLYQVKTTNVTDLSTTPAIGIIISKATTTTCIVQLAGVIQLSIYGLLPPNKQLFIASNGKLTTTVPTKPMSGVYVVQVMGQVLSDSILLIDIKSPIILVA